MYKYDSNKKCDGEKHTVTVYSFPHNKKIRITTAKKIILIILTIKGKFFSEFSKLISSIYLSFAQRN